MTLAHFFGTLQWSYFAAAILGAIPFSIPPSTLAYLAFGVGLGLAGFPGLIYSLDELAKGFDNQHSALVQVSRVMTICVITLVLFGIGLRSLNNMVASVGGQFPFYSTLQAVGRFVEPIVIIIFGAGAVLIHRRLPFSPFKGHEGVTVTTPSRRRSPGRVVSATGWLLVSSSVVLGLFDAIALEALILLVTGLILLPTGYLIRKIIRKTKKSFFGAAGGIGPFTREDEMRDHN